ncbi:ABC transporter substrate-binding protein [Subtercola frigoramans]|uniref:Osmoprotectant transport system substrate-binding protein n=1 Tax=Subtercola frigoramans TaxID=120298 RepID=A0ABS2L1F9_9MICO|nr:ABC transporter substrate-binding protein [Subtercola frigoramans]MBM7470781.1 osmoprotectant transport system substrate-binding protein [Subtercola frigoramans]
MTHLRTFAALALGVSAFALVGCSATSADPLGAQTSSGASGTAAEPIVIGSQAYYSNEILAEIYAEGLEADGFAVKRQFNIGQREAYLPELESGNLDLFPEYTGPLLQYWQSSTTLTKADEVYTALAAAAPAGLQVLDQSAATDQDSYVVTRDFSEKYGVKSIADLLTVPVPLTLGGNAEGADRPNGPKGLLQHYGVTVGFSAIDDGGGPLTVSALKSGAIQLAIVYTASPTISSGDLVVLDDPEGLFVASHVVPVASKTLPAAAVDTVNRISAALTPEDLVAMNVKSVDGQQASDTIAAAWLAAHPS